MFLTTPFYYLWTVTFVHLKTAFSFFVVLPCRLRKRLTTSCDVASWPWLRSVTLPYHGWQLVVQGIICPKTPSGACTKYWRLCLALLRELPTIKWHHLHYCIPNPMLWLSVVQRVWPWNVDVDVQLAYGVQSTCCISRESVEAGISRSWRHQMNLHHYAFQTYEWAGLFHHTHLWCQQHLEGACQTEWPTNKQQYEHPHIHWWYCKLGVVSNLCSCIHTMPAQSVPSLQSFTQPSQEPFFSPCFKFVGIDVCLDGNCPVKSRHWLLETWPAPEIVQDVAKLIGFCQFYSCFIPNFEIRVAPLRDVTKQKYTNTVGPFRAPKAQGA